MGMSSANYQIISADGHTIEPPHMWETYLPAKFHDRMPRLVKDPKGGDAWELVPGAPAMPLGLVTSAGPWGKRYEELEWYGSTYDTIRAGAFDGKARLQDQDIDGISAEVLYPSQRTMGTFMAQPDDDYHLAGIDAYNQWMHDEFMAVDPQRLIGLYQMPAVDIDVSVAKLREAKSLGFRGVILSAYPSGNAALSDDDDPFWAAAEEESIPVHIHVGLSQAGTASAEPGARCAYAGHGSAVDRETARPAQHGWCGRERVRLHVGVHLLGHVRPLPGAAHHRRGDRRRMGPEPARAHGRPLVAQPHVDRLAARVAPERVLPPQLAHHVHPRAVRGGCTPLDRREQHDVVDGLSAPPPRLALQPARDRRVDGRRARERSGAP